MTSPTKFFHFSKFALSKTSILVPDLLLFRFLFNLKGIHFMSTRSKIPLYNQALLTSTLVTKTKPKIAPPFAGALFNEKIWATTSRHIYVLPY